MRSPDNTNGDRHSKIRQIFDAAVVLSGAEQCDFVARASGGDETIRAAVIRLLAADRVGTLGGALALEGRATAESVVTDSIGRTFGPYRTTCCIGVGGMGVVYKATREDDAFSKTVAIKVLPGGLETKHGIERFQRERQILASLEHPNIARLLDGGTTDEGLPYLVMEYIEGLPLEVYAEKAQCTLQQRLKLFLDICRAIEYAHRRLVVHCDLKPSNILVTADGCPKVLDFGIARLLDEMGHGSTASAALMTPEFASPEQVLGQPISTASDVYSLGVLLFLLLSKMRPYGDTAMSREQVAHAVCEKELPVGAAGLPKDLRNIVGMATRKEAGRRYASVEQFAGDIERYLKHQPVMARHGSVAYRAGKFLRRNRTVLAVAMAALVAIGFAVGSSVAQSRRAERRFEQVRGLSRFLVFQTYDGITRLPGSAELRREVLTKALQYLDALSREASGDRLLLMELAESYTRLGDAQGGAETASLGDTSGALESFRKARSALDAVARDRNSERVMGQFCVLYAYQAPVQLRAGQVKEALGSARSFLDLAVRLRANHPNDPRQRYREGCARLVVSQCLLQEAENTHSMDALREALQFGDQVVNGLADPSGMPQIMQFWPYMLESNANDGLANAHCIMGDWTGEAREYSQALEFAERSLKGQQMLMNKDPKDVVHVRDAAKALNRRGLVLERLGRYREADQDFRDALERFERLAGADPSDMGVQKDIADVCRGYAEELVRSGRRAAGAEYAERAKSIYAKIAAQDSMNAEVRTALEKARRLASGSDAHGAVARNADRP